MHALLNHNNHMNTLLQLQAAVIAARSRTGDKHIGTQVTGGLIDVVRAVPPEAGRGRHVVTVLRAGLKPEEAVLHLGSMK